MPEVLEDAGVSWKVYNPHGHDLRAGLLRAARDPRATPSSPTSPSTRTRARRSTRRRSCRCTRTTSWPTSRRASCRPSAGSSRRPATTSTLLAARARRVVHQPGAGRADVEPRGVVQDRALPHVRRERRLLRPRAAAGPAEGHAGRVPDAAHPARRRQGHPRARSAWASGCPCWWSRPSAGAATWRPRSSTTPRSCASWRSASACGRPTSRPGGARPRATSRRRCTWAGRTPPCRRLPSTADDQMADMLAMGCTRAGDPQPADGHAHLPGAGAPVHADPGDDVRNRLGRRRRDDGVGRLVGRMDLLPPLQDMFEPPLGRRRDERGHVPVVGPAGDRPVPDLVHRGHG